MLTSELGLFIFIVNFEVDKQKLSADQEFMSGADSGSLGDVARGTRKSA